MSNEQQFGNENLRPGDIRAFKVISDRSHDFSGNDKLHNSKGNITDVDYFENILSPSITLVAKVGETEGFLDNLPIRGGEKVVVDLRDSKGVKLTPNVNVNRVRNVESNSVKTTYNLDLVSEETFKNYSSRVLKRYDGKISENVKKIMSENLNVDVDVDETLINYNFIGNNRKPLYVCTWLASKSIPAQPGEGTAGYLFYQTQDGFKFKSIDGLFDEKRDKKNYILSGTQGKPSEYDGKILRYSIERDIDLQKNLSIGAYSNRSIFFNFFNYNYVEREYVINDDVVKTGGSNTITENIKNFGTEPSRTMTRILDIGTLPSGKNPDAELETWKSDPTKPTYDAPKTMVQSLMRYNQLFAIKIKVVIASDFSLRAGDLIRCDFPEMSTSKNSRANKQSSGIYMISSLCHRLTSTQSSTIMTLVRDSHGTTPF